MKHECILDTGATDHMTPVSKCLLDKKLLCNKLTFTLPTGQTTTITHTGKVALPNNIVLHEVLFVPSFKFILLSITKLTKDNKCVVMFYPKFCLIQDSTTQKVLGIGRGEEAGLYFLINATPESIDRRQRFCHLFF